MTAAPRSQTFSSHDAARTLSEITSLLTAFRLTGSRPLPLAAASLSTQTAGIGVCRFAAILPVASDPRSHVHSCTSVSCVRFVASGASRAHPPSPALERGRESQPLSVATSRSDEPHRNLCPYRQARTPSTGALPGAPTHTGAPAPMVLPPGGANTPNPGMQRTRYARR